MSRRPAFSGSDTGDSTAARSVRLGVIVLLHVGFFLLILQGGVAKESAPPAPKTVFVNFVTPEPPPVPQAPPPVVPPPEPKPVEPPPPPKPKPKPEPKPKPKPKPKPELKPTPKPKPKASEKQITDDAKSEPPVEESSEPVVAEAPPAPVPPPVAAAPAAASRPAAPPAPPAPPVPSKPKTITSGIAYLYNPAPAYPALSRRLGEEGTVMLRVLVNERGMPEQVELQTSSGSPRLDDAARRTVMSYRFKPHIENGRAVPVNAIIPINFQLD